MSESNLRPLGFGEILDGAFSLYRRHFGTFYLTALLPGIPLAAFWVIVGLFLAAPSGMTALATLPFLLLPVSLVAALLSWAALAVEVEDAYRGRPVSWRAAFHTAFGRFPALLGAGFVCWVMLSVGLLLFIIPGIFVGIMLFAVLPLVVLERSGPFEALGRSIELSRGAWGRIFGLALVLVIIASLPTIATMMVAGTAVGLTGMTSATPAGGGTGLVVMQLSGLLVNALTTPIVAGGLVLLYFDRRVRVEGLDLEIETRELVAAGD
jgi:hypothetical protein